LKASKNYFLVAFQKDAPSFFQRRSVFIKKMQRLSIQRRYVFFSETQRLFYREISIAKTIDDGGFLPGRVFPVSRKYVAFLCWAKTG